jgi:AcrR family transcriptional regulator
MTSEKAKARGGRGSKRARVMEEAARTLNSRGVSNASLPAIAARLGVSRAALYYYFEDQEDLVFQSYRRSCEHMAMHLGEAEAAGGDAMTKLQRFIDNLLAEDAPQLAALSDLAYLRPEQRNIIHGLFQAIKASIAGLLAAGAARGELRECRASIVAPAILGMVSWIPIAQQWQSNESLTHRELVDAVKTTLSEGIATDRRSTVEFKPLDIALAHHAEVNLFDGQAVAAAKQDALLGAASWLFNLKGVDATSLDEIAMRVGVTKKVIYHNLGDKETLVAECYRRSFRHYEAVMRAARDYDGPRIAAIMAANHAFARASLMEGSAPLSPLTGIEALPEAVRAEIGNSTDFLMDIFLDLHAQGRAEKTVRDLNARAIVAANPGGFEWLPKWFETLSEAEREAAPLELAELYRIGLLPI